MPKLGDYFKTVTQFRGISLDLVRIYIGVGLFLKGIEFIFTPKLLSEWLNQGNIMFMDALIAHYIIVIHLVGGLLLAIGLLTRIAAAFNIPILFGASVFVHLKEGVFGLSQNLQFTMLILFLLVIIFIAGNGPLSTGYYLQDKD